MTTPPDSTTPSEAPAEQPKQPAWAQQYDRLNAALPGKLTNVLPSSVVISSVASSTASLATAKYGTLALTSKEQYDSISKASSARYKELTASSKERWFAQAFVVRNEAQIPLNVSLNQVGPLYYAVIKPEETFERRVPNLPFSLEIRPYSTPSTAYTPWSTTWPILAVTGPAVALTSLLAIPLVAVAAGGTALASLTSFGSTVGSSVAAGTAAASEATMGAVATGTALVAKASSLPGARQVKGRLADAAKKAVGEHVSREKVQQHVVRYLTAARASAGAGGAEAVGAIEAGRAEEESRSRARKEGKVEEVEVTGYEIEKVLKCETGHGKTDKALAKAFKRLSLKSKLNEYKAENNPVLRVVGGPELETRTPPSSFLHPHPAPRTFLVFYPLVVLHDPVTSVAAEPIPLSEQPPTEEEQRVVDSAKVVEGWEEAEKAVKSAPSAGEDKAEGEAQKAVEEAKEEVQTEGAAGKGKEAEGKKKKGWLW
ncbi:hypothetical protein JCM10207_002984 [Rhodosporidiobolus poonsookiae]